jgi:hypothetical protein
MQFYAGGTYWEHQTGRYRRWVGSEAYPLKAGKFYVAAKAGPTTVRGLYAA